MTTRVRGREVSNSLDERRRALEEEFFRREDRALLARLSERKAHEEEREALARACGVHDGAVLDALLEAGIEAQTVAALALVPLVAIAWADEWVQGGEEKTILGAAERGGIAPGEPCHQLLEGWLREAPPASLFESWESFARALSGALEEEQRKALRDDFVARARRVAQASGGFLGLAPVSVREDEVLARIDAAFRTERSFA